MNATVRVPSSGPSTPGIAQLLKRADCIWMASPSLALLSVFIAGKYRPARLLVQEGSPSFVTNIGRIVGAVPEMVPLEDSEELRIALRGSGPASEGAWGVATHRREALVSSDWFEAFEARGIPTVELCMGGLFQLARRSPTAATVTIVSLDDEPAFEGAQLTALLTSDPALAERVRQLCLVSAGTNDCILDAAPRGLAEDETALRTVIEDAIAREEAAWAAAQLATAKTRGSGRGISLVWKRVFHSESPEAVLGKAEPFPVPPPRGKNPWLAHLAEAEQQHRQALDEANAALESIRAQSLERAGQAQAVIEEWRRRFEEAEAEAAARTGQQSAALEEARRRSEEHAKSLAAREERETRLTAEWEASAAQAENQAALLQKEKADLQAALALANNRHEALAQKLEQVEEQHQAALIEAGEREEALRSQSRDALFAMEALLQSAQEKAAESEARLAESHAETLAGLEAQISAVDQDRDQVRNRLRSALAERDRDTAQHEAFAAEAENARLVLVARAQEIEGSRTEALARIARLEDQTAQMTTLSVAAVVERDATALLLLQAKEAHHEALRLADEHKAFAERERAEETARTNAAILEWQARFDAAAKASIKESQRLETGHAALVARFQDEVAQLRNQAESSAKAQAREEASVAERISLLEREKVTLKTEREDVLSRMRQVEESSRETLRVAEQRTAAVEREKSEETSRLSATVTEWQARFDAAIKAAARESQRLEAHHAEMVARLQDELAGLRRQGEAAALGHTRSEAFLAQRLSELEQERIAVSRERDEFGLRLGQLERDKVEEASRLGASVAEGQARFDAAALSAAAEAQRMEAEHARKDLALERRMAVIETEKAGLAKDKDELAARLRKADEIHAQAQQLFEKRVVALEREKAEETARLNNTVTTWQARLDAAAKAAAKESQQLETRHAALVGRLQEKVAHLKEQGDIAAKDHVKGATSLAKQLSAMEREKAVLSGERGEAEARLRQAEERASDLKREALDAAARRSAEWQSRFDAAVLAAALESQRLEAHHAALVARLEDEVTQLRRLEEAAAKGHEKEAAAFQERLSLLEREKAAAVAEGREAQARLGSAEQRGAALQIEKVEENARWNAAVAELQSRLDAVAGIHSKEAEAAASRMALLEREKAAALGECHDVQTRLAQQEESYREALRVADQRAAASQLEKVEETARLNAAVSEWQSRFDAAAEARAMESHRLETSHGVLVARLQEEVAQIRGQSLSDLEREKAAVLGERHDIQTRMRQQEESHREAVRVAEQRAAALQLEKVEEAARLNATVAEWQSRFDAAAEAAAKESQRLEASHAALVARLQEDVDQLRKQRGAAAEGQGKEEAALAERLSELALEKAALLGERNDVQIRMREQQENHWEALRLSEQRASTLQIEKVEEAAQLKAALAEWQSRFEAARGAHEKESAMLGERLSGLERERIAALAEGDDFQARLHQQEEGHREALRSAEERAVQREKAEATSRLKAMAAEWQSRLDAATEAAVKESQRLEASHAVFVARLQEDVDQLRKQRGAAAEGQGKEAAALAERLSGLEREKTKVTGERDELEGRLSQMEKNHREALRLFEERTAAARGENALEATSLKATIVEWQSRFDAATKAATQESHRLETRQGTEVKRLQEALTQVREKAEAAARDHAREAATLAERLSVFERDTARVSGERAGVEARLSQAEESHREAMRLAEARLAEADARLRSAEARLAATAESWKAASEGAGQASESLRAALEARALESGAHFKAVDAWEAHRATLEQRIAELESAGVESSALQPRSQRPGAASSREAEEGGPPEFDESREDGGMGFLPDDQANDGSGVKPDASDRQASLGFVRWEYERVFQAAPEVEKSAVQSWVQNVARRIRRR